MGYQRRMHGESIIKVVLVASQSLIIDTSSTMKYILMLKICSIFALHLEEAPINRDLTDMTEEEFLDFFGLPDIDDQEEKERRREVLKQHQDEVKEIHEKFANGEMDWDAGIYEFSDLPDEDFVTTHTGLLVNLTNDPESDRFFNQLRMSRSTVPDSYSSKELGYVTPVRNQGNCGSSVAFATAAVVETCFKKAIGQFGDYSEQQMLDCAHNGTNVNGCNGASADGYAKWLETDPKLAIEDDYPYKGDKGTCSTSHTEYNQGVKVTKAVGTTRGDETSLKELVFKNGAVIVAVQARGAFREYKTGIFDGCTGVNPDHAVTVVGYGTESGVDYWLIKNSWGETWGEKGYIRMKRGVRMCGIGDVQVGVLCAKDDTQKCKDSWGTSYCTKHEKKWCGDERFDTRCQKTCKKC